MSIGDLLGDFSSKVLLRCLSHPKVAAAAGLVTLTGAFALANLWNEQPEEKDRKLLDPQSVVVNTRDAATQTDGSGVTKNTMETQTDGSGVTKNTMETQTDGSGVTKNTMETQTCVEIDSNQYLIDLEKRLDTAMRDFDLWDSFTKNYTDAWVKADGDFGFKSGKEAVQSARREIPDHFDERDQSLSKIEAIMDQLQQEEAGLEKGSIKQEIFKGMCQKLQGFLETHVPDTSIELPASRIPLPGFIVDRVKDLGETIKIAKDNIKLYKAYYIEWLQDTGVLQESETGSTTYAQIEGQNPITMLEYCGEMLGQYEEEGEIVRWQETHEFLQGMLEGFEKQLALVLRKKDSVDS